MPARAIALALTLLTGFSGLVYQVAWQKYLAALLGSHAEATAAVLGIFLGGLSAGYAVFGRVARRLAERPEAGTSAPALLRAYGAVELGIGAYALLFPTLFSAARTLSLHLPGASSGLGFGFDVALCALLIAPPTVLMGGTIPLLTQGLSRHVAEATRLHSFVYATNTLGAFAGALAAGFYLVPALGLRDTVLTMGLVNLVAGAVFVVLGLRSARSVEPLTAPPPECESKGPHGLSVFLLVAGLSGFAMMTLQTALNRIGALAMGGSHFTFSMVVAIFVFSIAVGSLVVSVLPRIPRSVLVGSQWLLVILLLALYPLVEQAPYWAHVVRIGFGRTDLSLYPYFLSLFLWSLGVLVVPIGLAGATLPLLFHHLRGQFGDLGSVAGRLYAWNTVGSLVGALVGGYLLLFVLDLHHAYRLAVLALVAGASLLTAAVIPERRLWGWSAAAVGVIVVALVPAWQPELLAVGGFRAREAGPASHDGAAKFARSRWSGIRLVSYDDDPTQSVAVARVGSDEEGRISIINNGKSDGNIPDDNLTMGLLGLLPTFLVDTPRRAFVIGYGTGYSVGAVAAIDSVEEVAVVEISPAVLAAAPHFEALNGGAGENPKVRMIQSDAYRALLRQPDRFDVIVSEPSNPWVAGVEMLYTRDFLRAARNRLAPGGVYAQWFHLYEMDQATVALVLRTYLDVFDHVAVWEANRVDLIILGFQNDPADLDLAVLEKRFAQPDFTAGFWKIDIRNFAELLAHELTPAGALRAAGLPDRVHTILHPKLSHAAARAFFRGRDAWMLDTSASRSAEAAARSSLARRHLDGLPDWRHRAALKQMARESCSTLSLQCPALIGRWAYEEPDSIEVERAVASLRRTNPMLQEGISDANLARISRLYGNGDNIPDITTYELARETRSNFRRLYSHAVPFDAELLHLVWERCSFDPRCSMEIADVREIGWIRP